MQAIVTKFLPTTHTKGSRVKATCVAGSITINWGHGENSDENHQAAAEALIKKLGWTYAEIIGVGGMPDGTSYCFVLGRKPVRNKITFKNI